MRTLAVLSFLFLLVLAAPAAFMQEDTAPYPAIVIPNTQMIDLTATTNGHDYRISVALPASYDTSDQSYPVLYVLDPSVTFLSVVEFTRSLAWAGELPEIIVVGIGYPTDDIDAVLAPRDRDLYSSPDNFLAFVGDELFPLIGSSYRTTSDRGLIGHALSGDYIFHVLITNPGLFNRYIAINGTSQAFMGSLMRNTEAFRNSFAGKDIKLFIVMDREEVLSTALNNRAYEGLTAAGLSLGGGFSTTLAQHRSLATAIFTIYCGMGESACGTPMMGSM